MCGLYKSRKKLLIFSLLRPSYGHAQRYEPASQMSRAEKNSMGNQSRQSLGKSLGVLEKSLASRIRSHTVSYCLSETLAYTERKLQLRSPDTYSNCGTSAHSGVSFQIFLDNMQTVRCGYIKVWGKTTYFALVLQSLYVSGKRYCIFLSV